MLYDLVERPPGFRLAGHDLKLGPLLQEKKRNAFLISRWTVEVVARQLVEAR